MNVYEIVTQRIIDQLQKGVIPWRRPWTDRGAFPVNWKTGRPYRGVNAILLEPGEYATIKQINEAGGRVKKGQKAHIVVFWKWIEKEENQDDEPNSEELLEVEEAEPDEEVGNKKEDSTVRHVPMLRYYRVFEINTQCEGLQSRYKPLHSHNPIEEAEKIVRGYKDAPAVRFIHGRAYYSPVRDEVGIPPMSDFEAREEYYATLFHEFIHSTGHPQRLNRRGVAQRHEFGGIEYSFEELVAEIGASMLCAKAGIENVTLENSVAYIGGWLKTLQGDKRMVVLAASAAQKAADYILKN